MAENVKVLHLDNCIVRLHYPEAEEEYEKQIRRLKEETAEFLMDAQAELIQKAEKPSKYFGDKCGC